MYRTPRNILITATVFLLACDQAAESGSGGQATLDSVVAAALDTTVGPVADGATQGNFATVLRTDPMTDRDVSSAVVLDATSTARLLWRCDGADIDLILGSDEFLDSDATVRVQWRLDDREPSAVEGWNVSTRGTGVFAPDASLVAITESGMNSDRIRFRVTDFRGTPHDFEFSLQGLAQAVTELPCTLERPKERLAASRAAAERVAATNRARADSVRQAEQEEAAFLAEHPWVGNPITNAYFPTSDRCWRGFTSRDEGVFFTSREEAEAAGFRRSNLCRNSGEDRNPR